MASLDLAKTEHVRPIPRTGRAEEWAFINHLRLVALGCRAKARSDLFEACALLAVERTVSRQAHAEALMRCLDQALGARPLLHSPGTDELSFDESWLLRLGKSLSSGDESSATFLLVSRVVPHNRRHIRFLVGRIAECFSLI